MLYFDPIYFGLMFEVFLIFFSVIKSDNFHSMYSMGNNGNVRNVNTKIHNKTDDSKA